VLQVVHELFSVFIIKFTIIIGTFLIIVLMITAKGYLIDKLLPTGYITNKVENHNLATSNGMEALGGECLFYC